MKNNSELQTDVRKGIKWGSLLNAIPIGVNVLIEKIRRKLANFWYKTDKWIVAEVLLCLKANCSVSNEKFTLISEDGWVSLEGEFIWNHGTEAAKNALHYLAGVRVVTNNIKIKSENQDAIEKKDVETTNGRSWSVDVGEIYRSPSETTLTLSGTEDPCHQREDAARIDWNTPGIWQVKNELCVKNTYTFVD